VLLVHYLMHIPFSLKYLALYQSGSILIGVITIYFYSRKYIFYKFNPTIAGIKRIIGYGGYIFGSGLLANICANIDQVMTAKLLLPGYVGYYNAAARINGLVDIPSYAASEVMFPKASRASVEEGREKVKYLYERLVGIIMAFTIPAAIIIILFPKLIISLIAGAAYAAGAPILQLYMFTGLLRPMQNQAANLLNSIGKPKLNFIINSISLVVYLSMNYICLKAFGLYGAAIGTLITMTMGSIAWYFIMRNEINLQMLNVWKFSIDTYKIVLAQINQVFSKTKAVAPKSVL
jgi:lipopolysaccharide exporter